MAEDQRSEYEPVGLCVVRPYLIVDDAAAALTFYRRVFDATELEQHPTPSGGIGHAKLRIGETIIELGEHPQAAGRAVEQVPRVGLRSTWPTSTTRTPEHWPPAPRVTRRRTVCPGPEARASTTRSA